MSTDAATSALPRHLPPLTRLDRCDRCSAAAKVRALLPAGELLFCGHHFRAHRESLATAGAVVIGPLPP